MTLRYNGFEIGDYLIQNCCCLFGEEEHSLAAFQTVGMMSELRWNLQVIKSERNCAFNFRAEQSVVLKTPTVAGTTIEALSTLHLYVCLLADLST